MAQITAVATEQQLKLGAAAAVDVDVVVFAFVAPNIIFALSVKCSFMQSQAHTHMHMYSAGLPHTYVLARTFSFTFTACFDFNVFFGCSIAYAAFAHSHTHIYSVSISLSLSVPIWLSHPRKFALTLTNWPPPSFRFGFGSRPLPLFRHPALLVLDALFLSLDGTHLLLVVFGCLIQHLQLLRLACWAFSCSAPLRSLFTHWSLVSFKFFFVLLSPAHTYT